MFGLLMKWVLKISIIIGLERTQTVTARLAIKSFLNEFSFGYISEWYDVRQKTKLSSLVKRGKGNKPEWISDSTIMLIEHDHTITI